MHSSETRYGYIFRLCGILAGVVLIGIMGLLLFAGRHYAYYAERSFELPNWVLLALFLGAFALVDMLSRRLFASRFAGILEKPGAIYVVGLVVFMLQGLVVYTCYFETGWDVQMLLSNAKSYVETGTLIWPDYFSRYPNNLLLFQMMVGSMRILGVTRGIYGLLFLSVLSNSISGLCTFRVIRKLSGVREAWLGYLAWLILVGTSPWLLITYSDSLGLFLPILFFDLFLGSRDAAGKRRYLLYAAQAVVAVLAYRIKPQACIIAIAVALIATVGMLQSQKVKKSLVGAGVVIAASVLAFGLTDMVGRIGMELDPEVRFSYAHFLMMGANPEKCGGYSEADVRLSTSYDTYKARNVANLAEFRQRLVDMKPSGCLELIVKKTLTNFNDGTYAWESEGDFYSHIKPEPIPVISNLFRKILYGGGIMQKVSQTLRQGEWLLILFLMIPACLRGKDRRETACLCLAFLGLVLFVTLFEARARYLYTNIPLFIAIAHVNVKRDVKGVRPHEQIVNKM